MGKLSIELSVNGENFKLTVKPHRTLLYVLRNELGLTGTKRGCSRGDCGACIVIIDGKAVASCLVLAAQTEGKKILTIEGLANGTQLHPIQEAFIEHGATQCGFCTPGMILSAKALLDEKTSPTEEDVREALSGNLCRCTGYVKPVKAVLAAAERLKGVKS